MLSFLFTLMSTQTFGLFPKNPFSCNILRDETQRCLNTEMSDIKILKTKKTQNILALFKHNRSDAGCHDRQFAVQSPEIS